MPSGAAHDQRFPFYSALHNDLEALHGPGKLTWVDNVVVTQ